MITLDYHWFSSALGFPLYNYPEGTKQYPCETVEDFEKIAWEVVKPEYDELLKKGNKDLRSKAFYLNCRSAIYYIMRWILGDWLLTSNPARYPYQDTSLQSSSLLYSVEDTALVH